MDCSFLFTDFINKQYLPHAAQVHGWMHPPPPPHTHTQTQTCTPPHACTHMHTHPCNPYVPPPKKKHNNNHTHTYAYRLTCTHIHTAVCPTWLHHECMTKTSVYAFYCFFHTLGCSMKNKLTVLGITSCRFATNTDLSRKNRFQQFLLQTIGIVTLLSCLFKVFR